MHAGGKIGGCSGSCEGVERAASSDELMLIGAGPCDAQLRSVGSRISRGDSPLVRTQAWEAEELGWREVRRNFDRMMLRVRKEWLEVVVQN